MVNFKQKSKQKFLGILLSILMVFGVIPIFQNATVKANNDDTIPVSIYAINLIVRERQACTYSIGDGEAKTMMTPDEGTTIKMEGGNEDIIKDTNDTNTYYTTTTAKSGDKITIHASNQRNSQGIWNNLPREIIVRTLNDEVTENKFDVTAATKNYTETKYYLKDYKDTITTEAGFEIPEEITKETEIIINGFSPIV